MTDSHGKRLETVTGMQVGDSLTVRISDGSFKAQVSEGPVYKALIEK